MEDLLSDLEDRSYKGQPGDDLFEACQELRINIDNCEAELAARGYNLVF